MPTACSTAASSLTSAFTALRAKKLVFVSETKQPDHEKKLKYLREAGYDDFVVLEKASGPGGTWFHNRYPGLQCDIASHLYSFSFEPHWVWSRPYGNGPEIREYMEHVVEKHGLREFAVHRPPLKDAIAAGTRLNKQGELPQTRRKGVGHVASAVLRVDEDRAWCAKCAITAGWAMREEEPLLVTHCEGAQTGATGSGALGHFAHHGMPISRRLERVAHLAGNRFRKP